jgi:predicted dehydrogenase/threonine dehydrogenase-like Zn-dependent dehydrogenase
MKQIIQDLKNGNTILEEIPVPLVRKGHLLIRTTASLVSLGTEKTLVEFGKGNLISKARQQPEKVKQVLDKIKTEGLLPTLEAVFNKLDEPLPLGYCNVGEVIAIGEGVYGYQIGDRVASNGNHAEFVCVPKNLCAKVPSNVSDEEACFTVIGSIGLQGVRLVQSTMGETVVVIGLGLIGLITVQLLINSGCRVIGFDFDDEKVNKASEYGAIAYNSSQIDTVKEVENLTDGIGADAVIIAASTKSNKVISDAAQMSRKRGRIVLIGVIGLEIQRNDFYKKELSFQVSCSYGPGRYDEEYEQKGIDYPMAFVRWTEQRNFQTILSLLENNKVDFKSLITERIPLQRYMEIYGNLGGKSIASIMLYDDKADEKKKTIAVKSYITSPSKGVLGIIGAGNFTKMNLMPALKNVGAHYKYICSNSGLTAKSLAKKYDFEFTTTDYKEILSNSEVDIVMITTRHDLHAQMTIDALNAGKNVFVEKPLALSNEELDQIIQTYNSVKTPISLTVGYNRRFSPFTVIAKSLLGNSAAPINVIANMNAGFIPPEIWVQDLKIGGGRIIGEACHYIDLMIYLTNSKVKSVNMSALGLTPSENTDNAIITLNFENGSQGVINYFSNGSKSYQKERIEIFGQGKNIVIDNFKRIEAFGFSNFKSKSGSLDKGHKNQFKLLINQVINGGEPLIKFEEIINSSRASFAALESLRTGQKVVII